MSDIEKIHCLIIGSGPAGYTAAIYAARANMHPVMYTGMQPGGQLTTTTDVENFPGYPDGVDGNAMMMDLKIQSERVGAEVRFGTASKVEFDKDGGIHKVWIDEEKEIHAETVIISTGATAKYLGLDNEQKILANGGGVSACAVCDGFFYKGKETIIVGAGDSACEEALYLSNLCPTVHMLVRKPEGGMRASKIMVDRVIAKDNIKVYWSTETVDVLGDGVVTGAKVRNNVTGEEQDIAADGFFVAIGHVPNTVFLDGQITTDADGYITTEIGSTKTNVSGVFACGDVQDRIYRQAVTAAGTGCMSALDAERYLSEKLSTVEVA
jgi:thioredoxin reductase (NADPH)